MRDCLKEFVYGKAGDQEAGDSAEHYSFQLSSGIYIGPKYHLLMH